MRTKEARCLDLQNTPVSVSTFLCGKKCTRTRRFEKTLCRVCGFGMNTENRNIQVAEVSGSNGIEEPLSFFGMCVCASPWCGMNLVNKRVTCETSSVHLSYCLSFSIFSAKNQASCLEAGILLCLTKRVCLNWVALWPARSAENCESCDRKFLRSSLDSAYHF